MDTGAAAGSDAAQAAKQVGAGYARPVAKLRDWRAAQLKSARPSRSKTRE